MAGRWRLRAAPVEPETSGVLPLRGERRPKPWFETPFIEEAPRFSPEGRWLAYHSNESGRNEVYVQPFPGPGGKRLISNEGGIEPIWSRSGRELFYRSGDKMMAVDIQTTPTFKAGPPHVLFEKSGYFSASRQYDVVSLQMAVDS
jgi:eukaryotic-like serine/threonine-protein kinase